MQSMTQARASLAWSMVQRLRRLRWIREFEPILRHPLTILGAATLAAFLCGLILHPRGLALAGVLVVVIALGVAWPWVSMLGLRGSITFERLRGREGQAIPAKLEVRNRAPWGAWGVAIRSRSEGSIGSDLIAVSRLGGWQEGEVDWTFVPDRRGEHPLGGAQLTTGFPFGLRESSRSLVVDRPVLVWPKTFPVGPIPEEAGGDVLEGASFRDRPGDAGDLLGVRHYRRGDPLRRVHWGQTARHGELIVCERQTAAAPRVQVVLDLDHAAHVGSGPNSSLEWVIRIAGSLVDDWVGQGADATLVVGDQSITGRKGTVVGRRQVLLDALARLDETAAWPTLSEVLDGPICRQFGRGLRIVVCTDLAQLHAEGRGNTYGERFVLLASSAFSENSTGAVVQLNPNGSLRPWIRIDDPRRVAEQVLAARKEVIRVG